MNQSNQTASRFLKTFDIIKYLLEKGSFGTVYVVKEKNQPERPTTVIKIVDAYSEGDFSIPYSLDRCKTKDYVEQEATLLKTLSHPNVVKLLDYWIEQVPRGFSKYPNKPVVHGTEGVLVIQMEFCDHGSLHFWLESSWRSIDDGWKIIWQTTSGINYLHKVNIIHRDIKPANVLLKTEDGAIVVKIADFGFATERRSKMTSRIGTEGFRAPEVAQKGGKYTEKADIYSMGITFFKILLSCKGNQSIVNEFKLMAGKENGISKSSKDLGLFDEEFDFLSRMTDINPTKRLTSEEVLSVLKMKGEEITRNISPFDTTPEEHTIIAPTENYLPLIEKCQKLRIFSILNFTPVHIPKLLNCLATCKNLEALELEIVGSGDYSPVKLENLKKFNLHHKNRQNENKFKNACQLTKMDIENMLFFGVSATDISAQIISNKMSIKLKIQGADLINVDACEGTFIVNSEATFEIFESILESNELDINTICIHNVKNAQPQAIQKQAEYCRDLEFYGTTIDIETGQFFSGFSFLERLFVDGSVVKCFNEFDLSFLSQTLNFLILKSFQIKLPSNTMNLRNLTLEHCILPQDFGDKYEECFDVDELTILSPTRNEDGQLFNVYFVPNFDFVYTVMNTSWEIIRFVGFEWTCSSKQTKMLRDENFSSDDINERSNSLEIIGKDGAIDKTNCGFDYSVDLLKKELETHCSNG